MRPLAFIALSTLCWSIMELLGASARVSGYEVVWTRYATHLLWMLVLFGPRYGTKLIRSPFPRRQIGRSLLMLGMPLCFLWSIQRMTMRNTMTVFWLAPFLVVVLAWLFGDSRVGLSMIAASIPGFLGAVLINRPDARLLQPAALLALGMALCFAMYLVVSRRMKDELILCKLFHTALWVFAALTFALPLFWQTPSPGGLLAMIGIGLLGWCGLYTLDRGVELAPPAWLAPMLYTQLIWSQIIEAMVTRHFPGPRMLAGMLLAAGGSAAPLLWNPARHTMPNDLIGCPHG